MPIIPLITQQRPTTDAAAPVLDRERRPTIDTSEVQTGLRRVNDANKAPLMDPAVGAAPFEALGSIGRAIQHGGGVLGALAVKRQEAEADFQVAEFDKRLSLEMADFQAWKADKGNAPGEWEPEWTKRLTKLRQEFDGNAKLNTSARRQIGLKLIRWEGDSTASVAQDATKHTFSLAKSAMLSSAEEALQSGDFVRHGEIVRAAQQKGYLYPHEVTAEELRGKGEQIRAAKMRADAALESVVPQIEEARKAIQESPMTEDEKRLELSRIDNRHARQKERLDLFTLANDDPDRAIELAEVKERDGKLSGIDRIEIQEAAFQTKAANRKTAVTEYKERILMKDLPAADELKNDQRLSDFDRYSLAAMATGAVNDPKEFESALSQVMTFDPSQFSNEREAITAAVNLETSIEARFNGAALDALKRELTKRQGRKFDSETEATDLGPALKLIDEAVSEGGLGAVKRQAVDKETGLPLMRDAKEVQVLEPSTVAKSWWMPWVRVPGPGRVAKVEENSGNAVPVLEPDPVAMEKAAAVQRDIRRTLESEVKAGRLKDQAAITARAIELFKAKGGKMIPAPTSSAGPNPLLPSLDASPKDLSQEAFQETLKRNGY